MRNSLKVMLAVTVVLSMAAFVSLQSPSTPDQHDACWYKMQATARYHLHNATPEEISDAADGYCRMARDLSRNSDMTRSEAEAIISRM